MRRVHSRRAASNCSRTISIAATLCPCVCSYYRDDLGRLVVQPMGQVLVEGDEVRNVDVAEVLPRQHVLADLVSANTISLFSFCGVVVPVDEDIVEMEVEDELDQLLLDALVALLDRLVLAEQAERVH
jgi:hypothetical protein